MLTGVPFGHFFSKLIQLADLLFSRKFFLHLKPNTMKNYFVLLALMGTVLWACDDDEQGLKPPTVTYEVIAENGAFWYGEFADENGNRVNTFDLNGFFTEADGHRMPSGWRYNFEPKGASMELMIHATAFCAECNGETQRDPSPSITVNIYIDNELVWTETDACRGCTVGTIKGLATAWLLFPEEWQ
jgi:hypothetical protein